MRVTAVDSSAGESARHSPLDPASESRFARVSVASIALSFYNPRVGNLEPIIEPFQVVALAYSVDAALSKGQQRAVQPSSFAGSGGALSPVASPRDSVALSPSLQRSSASRPLRVVDVALSQVEVVVSHAAVATLVPAFTTLQSAATRLALADADASVDRGADLAAAQEEATMIGDGVLQHASVPPSALPVVFRNSSGFPAVLCVMRTTPGASDPCVVFFSTPQPDASLGGVGLVSADDAASTETLRAAVEASVAASDDAGKVALISVPHGCAVGLATAPERSSLGAVTALPTGKDGSAVAAAAMAFPALRVYAGSDASKAVADLPPLQALAPSFAESATVSPDHGAAPLPIIIQVGECVVHGMLAPLFCDTAPCAPVVPRFRRRRRANVSSTCAAAQSSTTHAACPSRCTWGPISRGALTCASLESWRASRPSFCQHRAVDLPSAASAYGRFSPLLLVLLVALGLSLRAPSTPSPARPTSAKTFPSSFSARPHAPPPVCLTSTSAQSRGTATRRASRRSSSTRP